MFNELFVNMCLLTTLWTIYASCANARL